MTLTNNRYVLAVRNLQTSAAFYRDMLGFEIHEIGDPGWRFFKRDRCTIMAGECSDAIPASELGDHSYFAYIDVEDIDGFYAEIVGRGAPLIKKLRNEPWGMREFGVRTIDGHRMMFGSPVAS